MPDKIKDLEEALYQYARKHVPGKQRTLEDALERALELKPEEIDEVKDDEWI